jgi:hypothetical protein
MVTLKFKNKDGTVSTNPVMNSDKAFWLSQGWTA